jgi:hypothetical protein
VTRPVVIVKHPKGPRLYVAGRRVHHGTWGCLAVATGAWLAWWDRRDWRDWLLREALR